MGVQVTSIPQQEAIAARPRRESLYDTEAYNDAEALNSSGLTLFQDARNFGVSNISERKRFGRDTNIVGTGGTLPKAWHHYLYGVRGKFSILTGRLDTAANVVMFDQMRRIQDLSWFIFKFGTTPYIHTQLSEIPFNFPANPQTTHTDTTVYSLCNSASQRKNLYNVDVDGYPIEITEIESVTVELPVAGQGTLFSPTVEVFITIHLVGTLLKGLAG